VATLKVKVMPKDCPISQIVMNYTVTTIATEVPGMTDRGTSNGERGTVLGIYFYTAGTKMFPCSRPGSQNSVPGMWNPGAFPLPG